MMSAILDSFTSKVILPRVDLESRMNAIVFFPFHRLCCNGTLIVKHYTNGRLVAAPRSCVKFVLKICEDEFCRE